MANRPMPPHMQAKWGHLGYVRSVGRREWHSECPKCGSSGHQPGTGHPNRFHMHDTDSKGNARGICRRCGHFEWAQSENEITPEMKAKAEKLRAYHLEQERVRIKNLIEDLKTKAYWEGYHDAMREEERRLWRNAGIPDGVQDMLKLGYKAKHDYYSGGEMHRTPALSIPYFAYQWKPTNLQFRLLEPVNPADKYRFTRGLPVSLYRPDPDRKIEGRCLLLEGAKKSIVTYMYVGHEFDCVVACPSKDMSRAMVKELKDCSQVIICFDPDADRRDQENNPAIRSAKKIKRIGIDNVRIASLSVKADDFFVMYDGTAKHFMETISLARSLN